VVTPVNLGAAVCRDQDDDAVLATAVAGYCDCIITGDNDLLDLNQYSGIVILKPADFWEYEESKSP
jgi:predicted nucleic acid-binding protein